MLKEYRKEYAVYISLIGGLIILASSLETIKEIISFINKINVGTSYNKELVRFTYKNNRYFNYSSICCSTL